MTMTLELPATGLDETPHPSLHVVSEDSQEAVAAAAALETPEADEEITIRILKNVDDTVSGFTAVKGETFIAHVDAQGDTFIPWQDKGKDAQEIYLEAEEFEIVEALPDEESDAAPIEAPTDNATEPAAGGCAVGETPATTDSDQPATGNTQAEPATPPVVESTPPKLDPREKYLRDKSAMEERLAGLTIEEMKLKEQAKLCKKEREVLAEQLSNLIDDWERGPAPDAATPEPATAGGAVETASKGQPTVEESAAPAGPPPAQPVAETGHADQDEQARYRRVLESAEIRELSLPSKLEEKLTAAEVKTVWDLEALRGEISLGHRAWPKGIGKAKVTSIEDQLMSWLARNQETWAPSQRAAIAAADAADAKDAAPPRSKEGIDADNLRIADQQDADRDAEVAAAGVSPVDPLDEL